MTSCNFRKYFSPSSRRQNSRSGCIQKSANHIFSSRKGLIGGVIRTEPSRTASRSAEMRGRFGRSNSSKKRYTFRPATGSYDSGRNVYRFFELFDLPNHIPAGNRFVRFRVHDAPFIFRMFLAKLGGNPVHLRTI